jgi:hypothetical protein
MAAPAVETARDRIRAQVRREQELADAVLAAETRLHTAIAKADTLLAAQQRVIDERRNEVADALIAYVDEAGVGLDRAAIILGRPKQELARTLKLRRKPAERAQHAAPPHLSAS